MKQDLWDFMPKRHYEEERRSNPSNLQSRIMSRMVSLIAAKAYFFCLDIKETKNQFSRKASLPHRAITPQIRQNLGCYIFTLLSLRTLAFAPL